MKILFLIIYGLSWFALGVKFSRWVWKSLYRDQKNEPPTSQEMEMQSTPEDGIDVDNQIALERAREYARMMKPDTKSFFCMADLYEQSVKDAKATERKKASAVMEKALLGIDESFRNGDKWGAIRYDLIGTIRSYREGKDG